MYATTGTNFQSNLRRKQELHASKHANERKQQRAISQEAIELIALFGERSHDGQNGIRYVMTDKAMTRLERVVGHTQQTDKLRGCYVVLSAEDECTVITVGHRHD
ncbi:MAG: DUF4258 domain-containing protein [Pseudohongiella sp.]|nr:DUF4258 domain-containing protein [Pseudohongiella sp.]